MSDADDAFKAAQAMIEQARQSGATTLDFNTRETHALTTLPPDIASLDRLAHLGLKNTAIADLTPLQGLIALQELWLIQTQVADLTPLQGLTALQLLWLDQTQVSDLTPLQGLTALQVLWLTHTQVSDLTPLQGLRALQVLSLTQTQVSDLTPLQGLSALRRLTLTLTQVSDLTPLQGLTALQALWLDQTQVSDLTPLQGLNELQALTLTQTQVSDLSPLQGLAALQGLWLDQTQVSDLTPLQGLTDLSWLALDDTQITDLRPVLNLPRIAEDGQSGINFAGTPIAAATPELTRLSQIEDLQDRTQKTQAYFAALPPWPDPLPWEGEDNSHDKNDDFDEDTDVPPNSPAPLQVVEENGVLRPAMPGDMLDEDNHLRAVEGWEALRNFLADLADQRDRIDNAMPRLGKAMGRLETALGESYDAMNPVAVGTSGNRIIRQAPNAGDMLMQEDAADIAEFAAALTLFLERFPEWRAYRAVVETSAPDPEKLAEALPQFEDLSEQLEDRSVISPLIPDSIEDQIKATREDPEDATTATGLLASTGNVLAVLAKKALPTLRLIQREAGDIGKMTWTGVKKTVAAAAAGGITSLGGAAIDIFFNKAQLLHYLAATFPEKFGWLVKFLSVFGL